MKPLIVALALLLVGCATTHKRYTLPDGSPNVRMIVADVSYGLEAVCAADTRPKVQEFCLYGRAAIDATHAVTTNDPVLLRRSVAAILEQAAHDKPELTPYFEFGLKRLEEK